jgi:hypothetical protein
MFFSISKTRDLRFPNHTNLGIWIVSHDNGWKNSNNCISKGTDNNWLDIVISDSKLSLNHSKYRSFPLWWNVDTQTLTNLNGTGEQIWADSLVTLTANGLEKTHTDVIGKIDTTEVAVEHVTTSIKHILLKNVAIKTPDHLKLFLTGGIDTLLLLALLKYTNEHKYEYISSEHLDYDWFVNNNFETIKNLHWGYKQMHHWTDPSCLISGCPGDEFFVRGPAAIALWCAWHDIDFIKHLNTADPGYHTGYFLKEENSQLFIDAYQNRGQLKKDYPTKEEFTRQILNMLVNDHQHWHLGNTLTWTPYLDLQIPKLILRLPAKDLLDHFVNATINKNLISQLDPSVLEMLSTTKNKNTRAKLTKYGY